MEEVDEHVHFESMDTETSLQIQYQKRKLRDIPKLEVSLQPKCKLSWIWQVYVKILE